jgi:alkyl hydroperoxide reductase subunit AhpF
MFSTEAEEVERESMDYDVLVVGGGPAGKPTRLNEQI